MKTPISTEIKINSQFPEKNIGLNIPVTIEVEDLYACRLQVSAEVPSNARKIKTFK